MGCAMTKQEIVGVIVGVFNELNNANHIPYRTGNLMFNALKYQITPTHVIIYVDTKVAPYVPYTNEPWLSSYWEGKKNPNEGWWERYCEEFAERLARKLRGDIKT